MPPRAELRRRRAASQPAAGRTRTGPLEGPAELAPVGARRLAPGRGLAFAVLCGVCLLVATGYTALAVARARPAAPTASSAGAPPSALAAGQPELLYVRTDGGLW